MKKLISLLILLTLLLTYFIIKDLFLDVKVNDDYPKEVSDKFLNKDIIQVTEGIKNKLIDCSDESGHFGNEPLKAYDFMKFYEGKNDPFNGFTGDKKEVLYLHVQGLSKIRRVSPIIIGFRGDTAGVHRSLLTTAIYDIYSGTKNSIMFMYGSYIKYSNGKYQSVCHRRTYRELGYIGSNWPALAADPWKPINKFFFNHPVVLFSYSNGGVVKDQMLETIGYSTYDRTLSIASQTVDIFSSMAKFKYPTEINNIHGIVDIETNYSFRDTLSLLKFIKEYMINNNEKYYYASTTIEGRMIYNHIYMINALELSGQELDNGVIRYSNESKNVNIDIIAFNGYRWKGVNLLTQTKFKKNPKIKTRLYTGHYRIVKYSTNAFKEIIKDSRLLF